MEPTNTKNINGEVSSGTLQFGHVHTTSKETSVQGEGGKKAFRLLKTISSYSWLLTLNPPPTSPITFSIGTFVFSKCTSQAETQN